ncbi:MAG: 3-dehydroquinate synthase [Clostridia bacterium]|nr:3-dehydroquinate synthase [Clostridia bacterium]
MKKLEIDFGGEKSSVYIGDGLSDSASELFDLKRKVLVVTDRGVPAGYAKKVAEQCADATVAVIPGGEESKTPETATDLCRTMMNAGFSRRDAVVAVGGGVPGDIAGLAAALYMRGTDFYNIPTTVLSQVDSSIGGTTGVNLDGIKNMIGAFKQPRAVIVDPLLTDTLPKRLAAEGLAEALKMSVTFDADLFRVFESGDPMPRLGRIIERSLEIKADVVSRDEKEKGLRRVLNFGHTVGHAIESLGLGYYHGECVALGMTAVCTGELKARLLKALENTGLPVSAAFDREAALDAMSHDKKSAGDGSVSVIFSGAPGTWREERLGPDGLRRLVFDNFSSEAGNTAPGGYSR